MKRYQLKSVLLLFLMAVVGYVSIVLACSVVPGFFSITDSPQKELIGFAVARATDLTKDPQANWSTVSLRILQWIGPQRSDTLITARHRSYQDHLYEYSGGPGIDCSELIGRKTQYLIPIYSTTFWQDSTTTLAFPSYWEILGRRLSETNSVEYDELRVRILNYVYLNRRAPLRLAITTANTIFSLPRGTNLQLHVTNESEVPLPLPPPTGFQVDVRAFKNRAVLLHLYGLKSSGGEMIPASWPLGDPADSSISSGTTVQREIDVLRWYPYLPDTLWSVGADSLIIFVRLNWAFQGGNIFSVRTGISSISNSLDFRIDQTTSVPQDDNLRRWRLRQNYPNPFNPSTTISYDLPTRSSVILKIFNVLGQEVATLVDEPQDAGKKSVRFDASRLPSGMYMYRLRTSEYVETKKMILLR